MTEPVTRQELHRVATHILARRRADATGRFGLRATPGGFGTPAFGSPNAVEAVRLDGMILVHELGGDARTRRLEGVSLRTLAEFVGVDLDREFDAGDDTPPLGDLGALLSMDGDAVAAIADWFHLGWRILDRVVAESSAPSTIQLWPEHFDAGCSVAVGPGESDRCNLGASPGDSFSDEPYLYVGPWSENRPGRECFWNAPFGALLRRSELTSIDDGVAFFRERLDLLR
jgi:hypothetical protein